MLKFILITIAWYLIIRKNAKKKGGLANPSSFLLIIYFISFVFSVIHIIYNGISLAYNSKYWWGVIFAFISLSLYFSPYFSLDEKSIKQIKVPNLRVLSTFSFFMIVVSFFSIIYWLPYVRNIFLYSGMDLGDLRNAYVAGEFVSGGGGFFQTIAGLGAHLYYFNIIIYFIFKSLGINRTQQVLLLVSSFSYVVYVLSAVGRDGIVFWTFTFLSCYLFFRNYLTKTNVEKIRKLIYPALILMLVPFLMISSSRFTGRVGGSIISYMGQALPNFCFYIGSSNPPVFYGCSFSYICDLLNIPHMSDEYWTVEGTTSTSFGFFIENFYCSLGFWGFVLLEILVVVFLNYVFKKHNGSMSFSAVIVYFLFFQIFSQGVFYFRQYSSAGNILIIISFIVSIVFSFINNPISIKQKDV